MQNTEGTSCCCYLCHEPIAKNPLYIGQDTYRHRECDPLQHNHLPTSDKERADTLWAEMMQIAGEIQGHRLRLAMILKVYHQDKLYRLRGYETWHEFTNFLSLKHSWAYELLSIVKNPYLLEYVQAEPELLEGRAKHLAVIARIADAENVAEMVEKARSMTVVELRNDLSDRADTDWVTRSFSFERHELSTLEDAIERTGLRGGRAIIAICQEYLAG